MTCERDCCNGCESETLQSRLDCSCVVCVNWVLEHSESILEAYQNETEATQERLSDYSG